ERTAGRRNTRPACGRRHTRRDRKETRQGSRKSDGSVVRRKRIEQEREVVDQGVINSKPRSDRRLAFTKWIPGKSDSRTEQRFCLVLCEYRCGNVWIRQQNAIRVGNVIGASAELLVPSVCEF